MSEIELKPCPFCGGEIEIYKGHTGEWWGRCCFVRCGPFPSEGAAISATNIRTPAEIMAAIAAVKS